MKWPAWLVHLLERIIVRVWSWIQPTQPLPGGPRNSRQPSDNVMRTMNLVMPLKDKTAVGRARAALAIASSLDEIYAGLDNVGTVHVARFSIVENNILMFSFYDGDFHTYIRDFIVTLGHAFNAVVELVEDTPPLPCWEHVDAFIDWVHAHDALQLPDSPGQLIQLIAPNLTSLEQLPRHLVLQLDRNPNVQLGSYRNYPGYSAAQIREKLGIGW